MNDEINKELESVGEDERKQDVEIVQGKVEKAVKESVEKAEADDVRKELDVMVTRAELETKMEKMQKEYAKLKADYEKVRKDILRAKAQGKASNFEENEDPNKELKEIYPDIAEIMKL